MPIISVEITKTRDEKETQPSSPPPKKNPQKQTNKQTKTEKNKGEQEL